MFKRINNWHLSILVAMVSIISITLIQQYAEAQWTDPGDLPGGTPSNNLVVNPMIEDLQLGGHNIADTNLRVDGNGTKVIEVLNNQNFCLGGICKNTWPVATGGSVWDDTTDAPNISYTGGKVGIGTSNPGYVLDVVGDNGIGDVMKIKGTGYSSDLAFYNDGDVWVGAIGYENRTGVARVDLFSVASGPTDMRFLTGSNVNNWGTERMRIQQSTGNVGIGTATPNKNLHVYDGSGANAEIDLQSGSNTHWGMYQNATNADLTFWNGNDRVTFADTGNVGIGTVDPTAHLEIQGDEPAGSVDLRLFNSTGQDSRILFAGYDTSVDDFKIKWSGRNAGVYDNWLEFWGRTPTGNGRPVMTMQRDYLPGNGQYQGVGIGVAHGEQIDATLRVKNYDTEDIFQAYDDNTEVFSIKDGGQLCLNGNCINDWTNAGSGALSSYTVSCGFNNGSFGDTCTASCLSSDFVLTSWDCIESNNTSYNVPPEDCIQGISDGQLINPSGTSGFDLVGTGTCTNFTTPPVTSVDSYTVSCGFNNGSFGDTCTASCLSSDFVLTSWDCAATNNLAYSVPPEDCIQGVSDGQLTNPAGTSGYDLVGTGTCTKFQ